MQLDESTDRDDESRTARRWVVGVDGSPQSRHAARWAAAHASGRASELQLTATWTVPVSIATPPLGPVTISESFDALERSAHATVNELARCLQRSLDIPVSRCVEQGGAAARLTDATRDSSLVVVGSRGRGGFARLVLGSTSTQCATHASGPVAVVPATAPLEPATSIVVAIDGSDNSIAALTWAIEFAAPGSTIECISVWDTSPLAAGADDFFFPEVSDLAAERFDHLVSRTLGPIERADVAVRRTFTTGSPRSVLAEFAEAGDLLVMGARGHGAIGAAMLGSVSSWLLHHVSRPMAVIPQRRSPQDDVREHVSDRED